MQRQHPERPLATIPLALAAATVIAVPAATASEEPTYPALRSARPDGRVVSVKNFVLERHVGDEQRDPSSDPRVSDPRRPTARSR